MEALQHAPDRDHTLHLQEVHRAVRLPVEASGLHWHPFGVYALPLPRRTDEAGTWSRRLHLWHPEAEPVGEASPYGVHTHSGLARSHVVAGTLHHHLYDFRPDADGLWQRAALGDPEGRATLTAHVQAPTHAGMTHTLPADQPHGVSKPPGFAISLFEQLGGEKAQPFTTWQRTDLPPQALVRTGPVSARQVQQEALAVLEEALYALSQRPHQGPGLS